MARTLKSKIRRFLGDSFVLEGNGTLLATAALACAGGLLIGLPATQAGVDDATLSAAFTEMVSQVQNRIDTELPWTNIHVVDMSKPLEGQIDLTAQGDGPVCIVHSAPVDFLNGYATVFDMGDMGITDYSRWTIWTDVGKCLGADHPAQARTFGAMMTILDTTSVDFLPRMAAVADLQELQGNVWPSEFWSGSAYNLMEAMEDISMTQALDVHGISAALHYSSEIHDKSDIRRKAAIGVALNSVVSGESHHFMPVDGGLVDTNGLTWLSKNRAIPEIDHYVKLVEYLTGSESGPRAGPGRMAENADNSAFVVDQLAAMGDSSARKLAPAFGLDKDYSTVPVIVPVGLDSPEHVSGTFFKADLEGLYVAFAPGGNGFVATNADNEAIMVGKLHIDFGNGTETGSVAMLVQSEQQPATGMRM